MVGNILICCIASGAIGVRHNQSSPLPVRCLSSHPARFKVTLPWHWLPAPLVTPCLAQKRAAQYFFQAQRSTMRTTVDAATPIRRPISQVGTPPTNFNRRTSRTWRMVVLSAGIRSLLWNSQRSGPESASRGTRHPERDHLGMVGDIISNGGRDHQQAKDCSAPPQAQCRAHCPLSRPTAGWTFGIQGGSEQGGYHSGIARSSPLSRHE